MDGVALDHGEEQTTGMSGAGVFCFPRTRGEEGMWTPSDSYVAGIYFGDAPRQKLHWIQRSEGITAGLDKWIAMFPVPPDPNLDADFFEK